ncbi:MAG: hypothetical protein WCS59_03795 [Sphaerochaetaceae bacterium]|jgi:hypothetical protein|nr:hypothetical protein [Sphaerochaetaceae bacterium]MDD4219714.1 hypothetical protein [Sphaerochaetaceae bacterium]MDY0372212.1 hypothetical protein [Sphaerochaetaceae bacterium]
MDYEILLQEYQILEKALKDKNSQLVRLQKALAKEMIQGDLTGFTKDIQIIQDVNAEITQIIIEMQHLIASFDATAYFENGSFAQQMLQICEEQGVDIVGDFPLYEIFPYKVRIDVENQDIYIDRKKVSCVRPQSFVERVIKSKEKLMKASFNAGRFAEELASAYDLALIKSKKKADTDLYLQTIYKFLVPMSRFRKDYDQQSFAFDLARLYLADEITLKDGRKFQFGPSRNNKKAIRILDSLGQERYLATIRFFN